MTTINNLIDQVGGIEKAKEIVSGAPETATDYVFWTGKTRYINRLTKEVYLDRTQEWFSANIMVLNLMHCLDNLRTAIAQHEQLGNSEEFKVGDWVVLIKQDQFSEVYKYTSYDKKHDLHWFKSEHDYGHIKLNRIRHATPSEIKAGHRIDDTADHVTDIRNHVSPSMRVVDL